MVEHLIENMSKTQWHTFPSPQAFRNNKQSMYLPNFDLIISHPAAFPTLRHLGVFQLLQHFLHARDTHRSCISQHLGPLPGRQATHCHDAWPRRAPNLRSLRFWDLSIKKCWESKLLKMPQKLESNMWRWQWLHLPPECHRKSWSYLELNGKNR